MSGTGQIVDLFAGHGWDIAARALGLPDPLGIEIDTATCATRAAAGMRTLQAAPGFQFSGSRTKQFQQIGNAVPPLLARHVLAEITKPQ